MWVESPGFLFGGVVMKGKKWISWMAAFGAGMAMTVSGAAASYGSDTDIAVEEDVIQAEENSLEEVVDYDDNDNIEDIDIPSISDDYEADTDLEWDEIDDIVIDDYDEMIEEEAATFDSSAGEIDETLAVEEESFEEQSLLYASEQVTITWHFNCGEEDITSIDTFARGTVLEDIELPWCDEDCDENKEIIGVATDASGDNIIGELGDGDLIFDDGYEVNADVDFYLIWDDITYYSVTLIGNGGTFYELPDEDEEDDDEDDEEDDLYEGDTWKELLIEGSNAYYRQSYEVYYDGTNYRTIYYKFNSRGVFAIKRDGYVLTGWRIQGTGELFPGEQDCAGSYGGSFIENISSDMTLEAVWEEASVITFDYNGGHLAANETLTAASYNETLTAASYTCAKSWALEVMEDTAWWDHEIAAPEKDGFGFIGWKDKETGEIYYPGDYIDTDHDIELEAVWGREITITYDPGEKQFIDDSLSFAHYYSQIDEDGKIRITSYVGKTINVKCNPFWPSDSDREYSVTAWRLKGDDSGKG